MMRVLLIVVTALISLYGLQARAEVQVSDQFVRVAKAVAQQFGVAELKKVCAAQKEPGPKAMCMSLIERIGDVVFLALDKKIDEAALSSELISLLNDMAQAAVASESKEFIEPLLKEVVGPLKEKHPQCLDAATRLAVLTTECFITRAVHRIQSTDPCKSLVGSSDIEAACGIPLDGLNSEMSPETAFGLLGKSIRLVLPTKDQYNALSTLNELADLLTQAQKAKSIYEVAANVVASDYDNTLLAVTSLRDDGEAVMLGDEQLDPMELRSDRLGAAITAAGTPGCDEPTHAFQRRLKVWKEQRFAVFESLAQKLVTGQPLAPADLNAIPRDLPEPPKTCDGDPLKAISLIRRSAIAYYSDVRRVQVLDRIVWPVLMVAALVDFARTNNRRELIANMKDLSLRVLRRALMAVEIKGFYCKRSSQDQPEICQPMSGGAPVQPKPPAEVSEVDYVRQLVETPFSPAAAERTCIYQAVSSILTGKISSETGLHGTCRAIEPKNFSLDNSIIRGLLGDMTEDPIVAINTRAWKADVFIQLGASLARISLGSKLDESVANGLLADALKAYAARRAELERKAKDLGHPLASDPILTTVITIAESAAELISNHDAAPRKLIFEAARILKPVTVRFLDKYIASGSCIDNSLKCGVRLLVESAYDPVLVYLALDNPVEGDRRALATSIAANVRRVDPLSQTPLLFNVGLGVTGLYGQENISAHLTVLDKIGLAYRWGDRRQWEVGGFVGGFLDAIIRAATGATDAKQYWLLGGTLGVRQFTKSVPIGGEFHAGVAWPFNLSLVRSDTGFAFGAALLVPIDVVFGN